MKLQKTIKTEIKTSGKGLFGGVDAKVIFRPAEPDTGVVFVRTDLNDAVRIPAIADNIAERARRTALAKGTVSIETIEHCMAAIYSLEVDNISIEINGPEMPGFDGSGGEYVSLLKKAGLVEQDAERKKFVITEPITITEGDSSIYALPYRDDALSITYDLDYGKHTAIGKQLFSCMLTSETFEKNLAPARTFLLEAEAKQFQARGIGAHLSPKDILVISSEGPIKNSFRFENECVRHKIVDLIGDLALAGRDIKGRIVAYKSGHSLNQRMAKKLRQLALRSEKIEGSNNDALLDIRRIQRILPHRYPFLLVDKVIDIDEDKKITGLKNVTFNELFFQGHFPGTPIMPGVLIVEAMAQISGLLFAQKLENTGKLAVLLSMDKVKLRKAVVPGDQLILEAEVMKMKSRTGQTRCTAKVGDKLAAQAIIKFMLIDEEIF